MDAISLGELLEAAVTLQGGDADAIDRYLEKLRPEAFVELEVLASRLDEAFRRRYAGMDVTQRERDGVR